MDQSEHPSILTEYMLGACLLYTSDAADEGLGVDLGGRRWRCLLYTSPSPRD